MTAPVLDPGRGRTKTGQLWAYARDDRPFGGADPPITVYVYAPNRKSEQPIAHLADSAGVIDVDGYGGYRPLARKNCVQLAFCWSHVRRRFYELAAAGPARYALSRWNGLTLFVDDGRVEIDSNVVERAIRPIALNRKNTLFAGSDGGAENWAIVASLIETCKLSNVDPNAWMADTLTKIVNGHLDSEIDELLPSAYDAPQRLKHVA